MNTNQSGATRVRVLVASVALVIMAASVGALVTKAVGADASRVQTAAYQRPAPAISPSRVAPLAGMQDAFTAIAERIEPSLVSIRVKKIVHVAGMGNDNQFPGFQFMFPGMPGMRGPGSTMPRTYNQEGVGSGVIVRSDGWILTNDHVVEGADKVIVTLHDGRQFEGKVREDFRSDLAAVKIPATGLTTAEFGNSDNVKVGQWAIAFGSPFELNNTMTVGIISAKSRQQYISEGNEGRFYPALFQTDASINPGNSGGPLVDIYGRIIGINVAINSPSGGSVGIGFAIPSDAARDIVNQLIDKGSVTRGYLGVDPIALSPSDRQRYGVPEGGTLIQMVSNDTPASRAGLQVEDVVLKVDGKPVKDDVHFRSMIADAGPGTRVVLTVRRSGRDITVPVTLGTPPPVNGAATPPTQQSGSDRIGIKIQAITPDVASQYKLKNVKSGVVVTDVQGGSAAEDAGLQPGDVILRANDRPIKTPEDLSSAIRAAKSGDTVPIVVRRTDSQGVSRVLLNVQIP